MMIAIALAGYLFDDELARGEILAVVQQVTTPEIAETIGGLIDRAQEPRSGIFAGSISIAVLVFGASGVFTQLHDTFNEIWDVPFEKLRVVAHIYFLKVKVNLPALSN